MSVYSSFYWVTIEHYYTGTLIMPPLNGVSDGSIPIVLLSIYTAYTGNNWWATPVYDGAWLNFSGVDVLTVGQAIALMISVACLILTTYTFVNIVLCKWWPAET